MNLDTHQFATALAERLLKDMNNLSDILASNSCTTIEDYRFICGRIQGLAHAKQYLEDLAKQMEDSDG